jgi:ATP-dependent exoDNAse (exonuclease V) beta subunit
MELIEPNFTRVSDILQIFQAYAHVPIEKLRKAQELGTDIHSAIENFFNGKFTTLQEKKMSVFLSFLEWANHNNVKPILQESRFYDQGLKITGRIDLLAKVNDVITLVDFKTGSWAHPEIWRLQGTFYRHLIQHTNFTKDADLPIPDRFLFIQLQKDGSFPRLFEFFYDSYDWNICVSAIKLYYYFKEASLQKIHC